MDRHRRIGQELVRVNVDQRVSFVQHSFLHLFLRTAVDSDTPQNTKSHMTVPLRGHDADAVAEPVTEHGMQSKPGLVLPTIHLNLVSHQDSADFVFGLGTLVGEHRVLQKRSNQIRQHCFLHYVRVREHNAHRPTSIGFLDFLLGFIELDIS